METKIYLSPIFENPEFDTAERQAALADLAQLGELSIHPPELTAGTRRGPRWCGRRGRAFS